ncbi:adenosylcobinamide-GDP ribazoletransferase [Thalassotalea sp. 42_200_T64]|nr:adenosylcobinamide-GDP ribazoletransferase [Thalassotalea sp. 42_200_T64]
MTPMRYQLNLFYLALSFFSRIPVPAGVQYSASLLNKSARYFSLVGIVLAVILAFCYWLLSAFLPTTVVIVCLLIISLLLTGAFHEDGLADTVDGIGGGLTVEKRLLIMKDSRIGAYGAVSIVMALLLKYSSLVVIADSSQFIASLLLGSALSRAIAASLIFDMAYVSASSGSKSKPLAEQQTGEELTLLLTVGALPLLLFPFTTIMLVIISMWIFRSGFKHWLNKRIGGYTGDCLGAAQQISELLIYLLIIASSNTNNLGALS